MDSVNPYGLTSPCKKCPFRKDVESYLRPERITEIAHGLRQGETFTCHKTISYSGDSEEDAADMSKGMICAGALSICENEGITSQMTRVAERLGLYDATKINSLGVETYDSLKDWIADKNGTQIPTVTDEDGNVLEYEHCGVVTQDCVDPAGYGGGGGGGVYVNEDTPTCNPLTDACNYCGYLMCSACRADEESCLNCFADGDVEPETNV